MNAITDRINSEFRQTGSYLEEESPSMTKEVRDAIGIVQNTRREESGFRYDNLFGQVALDPAVQARIGYKLSPSDLRSALYNQALDRTQSVSALLGELRDGAITPSDFTEGVSAVKFLQRLHHDDIDRPGLDDGVMATGELARSLLVLAAKHPDQAGFLAQQAKILENSMEYWGENSYEAARQVNGVISALEGARLTAGNEQYFSKVSDIVTQAAENAPTKLERVLTGNRDAYHVPDDEAPDPGPAVRAMRLQVEKFTVERN